MSWCVGLKIAVKNKDKWEVPVNEVTVAFKDIVERSNGLIYRPYGVSDTSPRDKGLIDVVCGKENNKWAFYYPSDLNEAMNKAWNDLQNDMKELARVEAYKSSDAYWKLSSEEKENVGNTLDDLRESVEDYKLVYDNICFLVGLVHPYDGNEAVVAISVEG